MLTYNDFINFIHDGVNAGLVGGSAVHMNLDEQFILLDPNYVDINGLINSTSNINDLRDLLFRIYNANTNAFRNFLEIGNGFGNTWLKHFILWYLCGCQTDYPNLPRPLPKLQMNGLQHSFDPIDDYINQLRGRLANAQPQQRTETINTNRTMDNNNPDNTQIGSPANQSNIEDGVATQSDTDVPIDNNRGDGQIASQENSYIIGKEIADPVFPRFMATSWAFPYLKDFPFNPSETFKGDGQATPTLNLGVLPQFLDPIKTYIEGKDMLRGKIIPNWDKSLDDLISSTEVWFVTSLEAYSYIPVLNRFSNTVENLQIPLYIKRQKKPLFEKPIMPTPEASKEEWSKYYEEMRKWEEEMSRWANKENEIRGKTEIIDPLGCYCPKTGTILIWIDKVHEYADIRQLMFQKVLLHEFIHAVLDLQQRDQNGKMLNQRYITKHSWLYDWTEETLDNALVLRAYQGTNEYQFIANFIKSQPSDYARAIGIKDPELNADLTTLIYEKIQH